jgi:predicted DNA-binding protein with PD1-like motif
MTSRLISDSQEKVFIVVFENGDEVMQGLLEFARDHGVGAAIVIPDSPEHLRRKPDPASGLALIDLEYKS